MGKSKRQSLTYLYKKTMTKVGNDMATYISDQLGRNPATAGSKITPIDQ